MPEKPSPVVNSSPLIALVAALPDFDRLAEIVERFIIPAEVIEELSAGGLLDQTAAVVQGATWCEVRTQSLRTIAPTLRMLGSGEAAVIHTAVEERLPLVVIDEIRGRRTARLSGLQVIGSLGLLVELHHAKLLPSIEDSIRRMQRKGIYLSREIIRMTLEAAGARRA